MARKENLALLEGIDHTAYENVNWQDEEDGLNESVATEPELETSVTAETSVAIDPEELVRQNTDKTEDYVLLGRHLRLKRRVESLEETHEAYMTESHKKYFKLEKLNDTNTVQIEFLESIVKKFQASIDQLLQHGAEGARQFTTRGSADDTVDQLVEKYLAAGISNWRDAAGKYLLEMFTQEELGTSCPTVEGASQAGGRKPLDPRRIAILRDLVCYFIAINTTHQETIPKKGAVTGRIHNATKYARERLAARQVDVAAHLV